MRPEVAISLLAVVFAATPARATWTIVAVDPETRRVGAAGASCILGSETITVVVPDRGVAVAQAMSNLGAQPSLRDALAAGESARQSLDRIADRRFDSFYGIPTLNLRQYGVAALSSVDAPASFTGSWTFDWAGARSAHGVTAQGNTLRGPEVVEHSLAAFVAEGEGCRPTLADRLISALVAGSDAGGDARCAPELAALSAFIEVAAPGDAAGEPGLRLVRNRPGEPPFSIWREILNNLRPAPGTREENPVELLAEDYETWIEASGSAPRCEPRASD